MFYNENILLNLHYKQQAFVIFILLMGKSYFRETVDFYFKKYWFYIGMFAIAIVYLFFPNNNHLQDSWGYAGSVKHGVDLFYAHHLLYIPLNRIIYIGLKALFPSLDALSLMQFINGVVALCCLFLLRKIIIKQTNDTSNANVWMFFVGCSFGLMRFAVEAEVYIIPIFLSLLSSYFYLIYLKNMQAKYAFYSGCFASLACLFHQIHLFWGIGLFFGFLLTKKTKVILLYLISTPIVLIVYSLVLVYYNQVDFSFSNLFHFLAEYYYTPNADMHIGMSNLIITGITFFRTFFQVHGIVLDVFRLIPISYLVLPIVGLLIIHSLFVFFKTIKIRLNRNSTSFEWTHLLIFIFQFGFAFYSQGNSEFMVMLPLLIAIIIHLFLEFDVAVIKQLAFAMLIWNFAFAIFPNHHFNYQNNKELLTVVKNNPDKVFILKESGLLVNQYFYEYGTNESGRLLDNDNKNKIKEIKQKRNLFYTDILTKKTPYNRVNFTKRNDTSNLLFVRHIQRINSAMGGFYIDEVKSLD